MASINALKTTVGLGFACLATIAMFKKGVFYGTNNIDDLTPYS